MEQEPLDSTVITNPRQSDLLLRVDKDTLDVLVHDGRDGGIIYRPIALSRDLAGETALEEAVYDNPGLLSDFKSVRVIAGGNNYAVVPRWVTDDDVLCELAVAKLLPEDDDTGTEILMSHMPDLESTCVSRLPVKLTAFLRRTFNNPPIERHIVPLMEYFSRSEKLGVTGRLFVNLRRDSLDILSFDGSMPRLVNTFGFRDKMDAVYYIMTCREQLLSEGMDTEILVSGDAAMREEIIPILRKYVGYVMPVIPPSGIFKDAKETIRIPFELIVRCE